MQTSASTAKRRDTCQGEIELKCFGFVVTLLLFRECPKPRADRGRGGRGGSRGRGGDRGRGRGGGGGGGDMTCYNCQVWLVLKNDNIKTQNNMIMSKFRPLFNVSIQGTGHMSRECTEPQKPRGGGRGRGGDRGGRGGGGHDGPVSFLLQLWTIIL